MLILGMEAKCLIPEQCYKCKSLFDLRYDLTLGDSEEMAMFEPLCWNCRVISLFSNIRLKGEDY